MSVAIEEIVHMLRERATAALPANARKELEALGAPQKVLTTQDIIHYLQNPYSLLRVTVQAFVYQVWVMTQLNAALETIFYLQQQIQEFLTAWRTLLLTLEKAPEEDQEENIKAELKEMLTDNLAQIKTDFGTLTTLKDDLASSQEKLTALEAKRDALLTPCLEEWKAQQVKQVENFQVDFNRSLGDDHHYALGEKDKEALLNVRKATQIQLTHPELIPTSETATPEENQQVMAAAESKASNMFELTCCSRLLQKDGFNPDQENIKPSDLVKLLNKKVDGGKSTIAEKLTQHTEQFSKEDKVLAEAQSSKVTQLNQLKKDISKVRNDVEETNKKILKIHDELADNAEKINDLNKQRENTPELTFAEKKEL